MAETISIEKLNIPGITFASLLNELRSQGIEGAKVTKVQELPNNWLKIRLLTKAGEKELLLFEKAFFISYYSLQAKQQSSGFGGFLNKHLKAQRLLSIKQLGLERVFFFDFGSAMLVAEIFAKGNILLLDPLKKILGCMRAEHWSTRELKKGLMYNPPPAIPDLETIKFSEFSEKLSQDKMLVPALVKELAIVPVIAEEACIAAGLEKNALIGQITKAKLEELYNALKSIYQKLREDQKNPAVVVKHRENYYLLPFPLKSFADSTIAEFKSVNEALNELLIVQKSEQKNGAIEKKLLELRHSLQKQKETLAACKKTSATIMAETEKIYEHFVDVNRAFEFAKQEFEKKQGAGKIMYNLPFGKATLRYIDFKKGKVKIGLEEEATSN